MKIIQHKNGVVIDIRELRDDASTENTIIVDELPERERRPGFSAFLKYNEEQGLYWDYEEVIRSNKVTAAEFQKMLEEVL